MDQQERFVYDYTSADITATFYTDKFMRERSYFEIWQKQHLVQHTFNKLLRQLCCCHMNILQLGQFASRQERDDVTYAVRLFDCYPKTISAVII